MRLSREFLIFHNFDSTRWLKNLAPQYDVSKHSLITVLTKKTRIPYGIYVFIYTRKKENRGFFLGLPISLILTHKDCLHSLHKAIKTWNTILDNLKLENQVQPSTQPVAKTFKYSSLSLLVGYLVCTFMKKQKGLKIYKTYSSDSRKTRQLRE